MLDRWRKLDLRNDIREPKEVVVEFTLKSGKEIHQAVISSLDVYNATAKEALRFSVNTCISDDVLSKLRAAPRVYEQKATATANVLRRIARAAGNYSIEITPWCDLVPADNGLDVLSAGTRMVFGQSQFAFAKNVKNVRQSAITFYETVVRSLAELTVLLNGSINSTTQFWDRISKLGKRFFGSSLTGKSIDTILRMVSTQAAKFQESLELVRDDIRLGAYGNALAASTTLYEIAEKLDYLQSQMQNLKEKGEKKAKTMAPTLYSSGRFQTEAMGLSWKYGSMSRKDQLGLYIMNRTVVFLVSSPFEVPSKDHSPVQSPPHWLSETELIQSLGVYFRQHLEDLDTGLKEQHQFDDATQSYARKLLQSPKFSGWISSQSPEMLWNTNAIVLHHFCGLHEIGGEGAVTGPNGLIRSLIFQLLFSGRHKFNLDFMDFINTRQLADDILSQSRRMLCHTFRQLIEQLPPRQTVISIVDGITGLEYGPWLDDLWDVVFILNKLVTDPAIRPNFKLLVTMPFADEVVDRTIMENQRLVLPSDLSLWR
ncbi:hypothetical protein BDW68DRAFT_182100 [Aspergillus falconensis]